MSRARKGGGNGSPPEFKNIWTAEELATLRAEYGVTSTAALALKLDRGIHSVRSKASKIGVKLRRLWTTNDEHDLRDAWGEGTVEQIAARLRRTPHATYQRAVELGLPLGCPDGYEYVTNAAKRTGYDRKTLEVILRQAGVKIARSLSRPSTESHAYRFHIVDPFDVDKAIRARLKTAPLNQHAREHGVKVGGLGNWIRRAAALGIVNVEPPPPGRRRWYVESDVVVRVLEWWRNLEPIQAGARRYKVNPDKLKIALLAAGVVPVMVGGARWVPREAVDVASRSVMRGPSGGG